MFFFVVSLSHFLFGRHLDTKDGFSSRPVAHTHKGGAHACARERGWGWARPFGQVTATLYSYISLAHLSRFALWRRPLSVVGLARQEPRSLVLGQSGYERLVAATLLAVAGGDDC